MKRFEISQEEYQAVKAAEKETKDKNVSRRLRVIMMRYEGYKVREIAEVTGMQINSISQLCRRYREQGLEEFKRIKATSHRHAMTIEKENEILSRFEAAAEAGHEVTVRDIKAAFDKERGKDTGRGYIYMLLKRHGWRKVMPRSRHPKAADKEACDASKKLNTVCWKCEKTCPPKLPEELG